MQPKCSKKWHQNSQNDCHSDSVTIEWNKREIKITYSHTHVPVVGVVATKLCWDITLLFAFTLTGLYPAKKRTRKQIKMLACFCLQSSSRASRSEVRICQRLKSREWRSSEYLNVKVFLVACMQTSPISFVARGNNGNRRRLQAGNISRKYQVAQQLSFLFAFAFFYRYLHFLCVFCVGFSYRPCHGFRRHLDEKANMWEIIIGMIKNMTCKLRLQSKGLS